MDAIEFVKQMVRMCANYPCCVGCPVELENDVGDCMAKVPAGQMVTIVEEWSKMNPVKTRQSVFLEQWPEAEIDAHGLVGLCPMSISAAHRDRDGECNFPEKMCRDCRREFWMQEVE